MLPNYIARNWLRASIDEAAQAYADGEADGDGGGERPTLIGSRVVGLVGRRMGRNSSYFINLDLIVNINQRQRTFD